MYVKPCDFACSVVGFDSVDNSAERKSSFSWRNSHPCPRETTVVRMRVARITDSIVVIMRNFDCLPDSFNKTKRLFMVKYVLHLILLSRLLIVYAYLHRLLLLLSA